MDEKIFASVDIGGSNIRIGLSRDLENIYSVEKFETPKNFEEAVSLILPHINIPGIAMLAIGVAGQINRITGTLERSPNLSSWNGAHITNTFSNNLSTPIVLSNDAEMGAVGEARQGAGQGKASVAYLAIGTGVGGARIIAGNPDGSLQGFEPGHQIIELDGRPWQCGQKGCLEAYISGRAFREIYSTDPEDCQNKDTWGEYGKRLGQGIVNVISFWSPDILVIGGGMAGASRWFLDIARDYVEENSPFVETPEIAVAKLGDHAGLIGGLELIKDRINNNLP